MDRKGTTYSIHVPALANLRKETQILLVARVGSHSSHSFTRASNHIIMSAKEVNGAQLIIVRPSRSDGPAISVVVAVVVTVVIVVVVVVVVIVVVVVVVFF